LEFGVGLTIPHRKKEACYEILHRASELNGFFGMGIIWLGTLVNTVINLPVP
jgi:hypothetical protein